MSGYDAELRVDGVEEREAIVRYLRSEARRIRERAANPSVSADVRGRMSRTAETIGRLANAIVRGAHLDPRSYR